MTLPDNPRKPERMSEGERKLRDRVRRQWEDQHAEHDTWWWDDGDFGARHQTWRTRGNADQVVIYTTTRMFDGRFWVMAYRRRKKDNRWILIRGSIRRRARRKDAKAIAMRLAGWEEES